MPSLLIAGNELRRRIRDGSILTIGVVAPLGLAFVLSLLLGGIDGDGIEFDVGLVDHDGSEISAGLEQTLGSLDEYGITLVDDVTDEAAARTRVGDDLAALVVVPAGFDADVRDNRGGTVEIVGDVDSSLATEITRSIVDGYLQHTRSTGLVVGAVTASGATVDPAQLAARAAAVESPVTVGELSARTRLLDTASYYTAAMAAFFVFFTVQIGVTSLLDERRDGTLGRLLAAPIHRGSILTGKAVASFLLGISTLGILAIASQTVLGADWGPWPGIAVLVVALVLAAIGIMAVVAGFAGTPESAGNIQSIVAITLGALGGAFFEIRGDGVLGRLADLSPHHWFLDGLAAMAADGDAAAALPAAGMILIFAVVTGAIGWVRLAGRLSP